MRKDDTGGGESMTAREVAGHVFDAGGSPTPAGPRPRDVRDVAEAVAHAAAARRSLRIVGGGTWLDAGRPCPADHHLDLSALAGIVEYVPGDLTLTALAGTPLAAIHEATAAHGQWLALDPFGNPGGTLGATLATASAGPLAATVGHPRDVSLGVEFVGGTGERIRAGGRVVKNVAGFDLVRLQVGAWGTLGVLTEATVRLRGTSEVDRTVAVAAPSAAAAVEELLRQVRHLPAVPAAAEFVNARLARSIGAADTAILLVRLMGNAPSVAAQLDALGALGECAAAPEDVWRAMATAEGAGATALRLSGAPAQLASLWAAATARLADLDVKMHATVGRGIVRAWVDDSTMPAPGLLASLHEAGTLIVERAPAEAWTRLPPAAADRLSAGLRAAIDPHGILNPGILGHVGP